MEGNSSVQLEDPLRAGPHLFSLTEGGGQLDVPQRVEALTREFVNRIS
jgi:hypothetical protein